MTAAKEDKRLRWVHAKSLFSSSSRFSHCDMGHLSVKRKKMEVEDSLRTLECLRGRLLAERQASRVAKEEAQLMGPKDQESVTKAQDFEDMKENVQDTAASTQNHSSLPTESSSSTRDTLDANYDSNLKDSLLPQYSYQCTPSCQDSKAETQSYSKLEAPMESNERRSESDNEDYVDNTLALVPVAFEYYGRTHQDQ
ncbi:hypothetical protein GH714_027652 [Hevea brasiliensis]|uniref:Uncharacterized protein n=1 Tax=Hevea brasiliensis TaxID=3981 RepID=A0A6A6ME55_HEVBR|nr:hypothetical protein GH714_027652 [Hevea brasiliensis]